MLWGSIFAALTHPLDTLKTTWYSDLNGKYLNFSEVAAERGLSVSLMAGLIPKLLHTSLLLGTLHFSVNNETNPLLTTAILAAIYPLLSIKSQQQIGETRLSFSSPMAMPKLSRALFAGLLPYLILSTIGQYEFGYMLTEKEASNLGKRLL